MMVGRLIYFPFGEGNLFRGELFNVQGVVEGFGVELPGCMLAIF